MPLPRLAQRQGIPLRTAERWVQQYRRHGLAGLGARTAAANGAAEARPPSCRPDRRPGPPATAPDGRRHPSAGRRSSPPSARLASARATARSTRSSASSTRRWSRSPRRARRPTSERFDLLYRREASRPNEIWQADHTPLDLWVRRRAGPAGASLADRHPRRLQPRGRRLPRQPAGALGAADRARRSARRSGARPIPAGTSAASPTSSTPTTAATSPRSTWSRSPPT